MGFKVDDEYYDGAIDYYKNQVVKIQECLDQFITTCNSLFEENNYGENIQAVLVARANTFCTYTNDIFAPLMDVATSTTNTFLDEIEENDTLS